MARIGKIGAFLLQLLFCSMAWAQVQDDFSDGNFSQNPTWFGDTARFRVYQGKLQLKGLAGTDSVSLYTSVSGPIRHWRFWLRMGFSPTNNNYLKVVLWQSALADDALWIRLGENGNADAVEVWMRTSGQEVRLLRGRDGVVARPDNSLRVWVERDSLDQWTVRTDTSAMGGNWEIEGNFSGTSLLSFSGGSLGFTCRHTSTNSQRFWFDDVYAGHLPPTDTLLPPSGSHRAPRKGELVINELMFDPSPAVGLPESEYVELLNLSGDTLQTKGLLWMDASDTVGLSECVIPPGEAALLTPSTAASLFGSVRKIASTGFPSLNNDQDRLCLALPNGEKVDEVIYKSTWIRENWKREGGWSLERIDPSQQCRQEGNWTASLDPSGGSPGRTNSVLGHTEDTLSARMLRAFADQPNRIRVVFNKGLTGKDPVFALSPNRGNLQWTGLYPNRPLEGGLILQNDLAYSTEYRLVLIAAKDCSGKEFTPNQIVRLGLPEAVDSSELIINEILYDPETGGYDYVELYNRSNKILDLSYYYLANGDFPNLQKDRIRLSEEPWLIFPGEYAVVCENPEWLAAHYWVPDPSRVLARSLPTFSYQGGYAFLMRQSGPILDVIHFDDSLHHPLLRETKGISLERIHPTLDGLKPSSWMSAARIWGSPGALNSQFVEENPMANPLTTSTDLLLPFPDGKEDFLRIHWQVDGGFSGSLMILDERGAIVRLFFENRRMESVGEEVWTGEGEGGIPLPSGRYLVVLQGKTRDGESCIYRKMVALLRQ